MVIEKQKIAGGVENAGALRAFINTKGGNREDFSQEFLDFMDYINTTTDEVADTKKLWKVWSLRWKAFM